ncbi:MAG: ABC transporter ATP-binding protein [Solirubrobacterales bacterium]
MPAKGASVPTETLEQQRRTSGPSRGDSAIEVRGAGKSFARRDDALQVLSGLNLSVERGEVLAVVGPSGCGKSTLLELICGLQEPTAGDIRVGNGSGSLDRLASCALMFQRDLLFPWRSALDNAALPLQMLGASRNRARAGALPLLERFGLAGFADARPYELSGGMRQRVAFVRTLLTGKPVLLLDEPFGSLDTITRAEMQEWLARALGGQSRTVVLVTHDVEEALFLADRVAILSARPGTVRAQLDVPSPRRLPRASSVTSADFVAMRQQALEALS